MPHPAAVEFLLSYLIAPERNISLTERNVHLQSNKDLSLNPEETGRMNGRRWQEIEEELDLLIPFYLPEAEKASCVCLFATKIH